MVSQAWIPLSEPEYARYWGRFRSMSRFRPSTSDFPGIDEPSPKATWSIQSAFFDPDPLMRRTHSAFNESMLRLFRGILGHSSSLTSLTGITPATASFPTCIVAPASQRATPKERLQHGKCLCSLMATTTSSWQMTRALAPSVTPGRHRSACGEIDFFPRCLNFHWTGQS